MGGSDKTQERDGHTFGGGGDHTYIGTGGAGLNRFGGGQTEDDRLCSLREPDEGAECT